MRDGSETFLMFNSSFGQWLTSAFTDNLLTCNV